MGMSTRIVGFKPPDEKFKKMKAIYDACMAGDVPVPEEVELFFEDRTPDDNGVEVDMGKLYGVKPYNAEMQDGFEVDLRSIPSDIKIIRFYNSY